MHVVLDPMRDRRLGFPRVARTILAWLSCTGCSVANIFLGIIRVEKTPFFLHFDCNNLKAISTLIAENLVNGRSQCDALLSVIRAIEASVLPMGLCRTLYAGLSDRQIQ